jgi:N-acetylmuramic acid 6-phosphate etherase
MASASALARARRFIATADEFRLGHLTTEGFHLETNDLDAVAARSAEEGLAALFRVDKDVVRRFADWATSREGETIAASAAGAIGAGGRIVFVGCGATGRLAVQLEAAWRRYWLRRRHAHFAYMASSVVAGGDYAVIRSVEGFEDHDALGALQVRDVGISSRDRVFALTEGGETPFVIGAAREARARGAETYFLYNNPDNALATITRSRAILDDPAVHKVNLTTGPMAVSGSTRMQATTMQQLTMFTILELTVRLLASTPGFGVATGVASAFAEAHEALVGPAKLAALARLVEAEEAAYAGRRFANYLASDLALDVLTDTTERCPTFSIPPFRKRDDDEAEEPWAALVVNAPDSGTAWRRMLEREPQCISWDPRTVEAVLSTDAAASVAAALPRITTSELLRFSLARDDHQRTRIRGGGFALAVLHSDELPAAAAFVASELTDARIDGARTAALVVGEHCEAAAIASLLRMSEGELVPLFAPRRAFQLDPVARATAKIVLNALSTCVMARLGRVAGNCMACVSPTNNKLLDRSTRYISQLAEIPYVDACIRLFEAIEHVEPRMRAGKEFPPVVPLAVTAERVGVSLVEAERRLAVARGRVGV